MPQRPTGSLFDVIFLTPRPPILWRFFHGVHMIRMILFLLPIFVPDLALGETIAEKMAYVSQLQTEISELDSKLSECKLDRKKWTVVTAVGGVGTVATGVGIGVQAHKLHELKKSGATEQDMETSGATE